MLAPPSPPSPRFGFGLNAEYDVLGVKKVFEKLTRERQRRKLEHPVKVEGVKGLESVDLMDVPAQWQEEVAELLPNLEWVTSGKNAALGVHWCLLPGINDRPTDAKRIAEFVAPLGRTFVHLIPYNPGSSPITRTPTEAEIARFAELLRDHGVAVRRRITKGRTVMGGCGQLGAQQP